MAPIQDPSASTPTLGPEFFKSTVEQLPRTALKVRWYTCVIVTLSAMNYPDVTPEIWKHLESHLFLGMSHDEKFETAQKVREGLTKSVGIVGAAKTGTTMRTLAKYIPDDLKTTESPRSKEEPAKAYERGEAYHKKIYGRNPDFNPTSTVAACPDYSFIVRSLFYGHIFSFSSILDDKESGFVIIAALLGNDSQLQLKNHMIGMLLNGATREELADLRDLCLGIARRLGVVFRSGLEERPIPEIPKTE